MIVRWVAVAVTATPAILFAQNTTTAAATPSVVIKTYCVSCHSGASPTGGVALDCVDAAGRR